MNNPVHLLWIYIYFVPLWLGRIILRFKIFLGEVESQLAYS